MPFQLLTLLLLLAVACTEADPVGDCQKKCGDIEIPYPFGTSSGCYLSDDFFINCSSSPSNSKSTAFLRSSHIRVTNITIDGQLQVSNFVARECYDKNGTYLPHQSNEADLSLSKFNISNTQNKFTVIGCDSYGYIKGSIGEQSYKAGCMSFCDGFEYVNNGSCTGIGCCQIDIPKGLTQINLQANSFDNFANMTEFNPCTYALVVEQNKFNFSSNFLSHFSEEFPVVLDWAITENGTCGGEPDADTNICSKNASCDNVDNGYLCRCKSGYEGNPYLSHGCQDIDECESKSHNCTIHECVNTEGSFTCNCRKGYHRDGQGNDVCTRNLFPVTKIALALGIFFVVLLASSSWVCWMLKKRKLIRLQEKFFQQNGGFLLQQQLSRRSGSSDTARIFTAEQLKKATNNYAEDRIIGRGGFGTVFIGFLADATAVAIKKSLLVDQSQIEQFINEVVVLSQINHRNVVRLLGCCLETEVPLLVYEFVNNGTLFEHIHNTHKFPAISWEIRLRIAAETADVLSYLHSAASTPIVHRDIKSTNILLDENYTAKVSDFGASKLVPIDETQLSTMVQGTLGYLDPEYLLTSQLTEKSDVYSFGVVLVELLTGMKALLFDRPEEERSLANYFLSSLKGNALFEILDKNIIRDGINVDEEQVEEVAELAASCLRLKGEERPTMREVAMELQALRMMNKHPWENSAAPAESELNPEEKQYLLSENPSDAYKFGDGSSSNTAGYDSIKDNVQLVVFDDGR